MHCPQCGFEQAISDDVRFCRQCGLGLDSVKELLNPASSDSAENKPNIVNIRVGGDVRSLRGLNQAALLLGLAFVPVVIAVAQGVFGFTLIPPPLLIRTFFILLTAPTLRFGYAIYEAKKEWKPKAQLGSSRRGPELPPARSVPVSALGARRVDTAEMIETPSVTENTTKLL